MLEVCMALRKYDEMKMNEDEAEDEYMLCHK